MFENLVYRLSQATPNARRLLALLVVVFVPLLLVFILILPLAEARRSAALAMAEADALHRWVHDQAAALPPGALTETTPTETASGPAGISRLETSLVAAGMRDRVSRLSNQSNGTIQIAFEEVGFDAFVGWLESASKNWGYDYSRLTIERADTPGYVAASLELAPAQ